MTLDRENYLFFESQREAYLAYRVKYGVAVTVGDPVGHPAAVARCINQFVAACRRKNLQPVFFAVGSHQTFYRKLGYKELQVAEDPRLHLSGLEMKGKAWQDVRTALSRARREKLEFHRFKPETANPELLSQFKQVSGQWVGQKNLPELGFTLGKTASILNPEIRTYYATNEQGELQGFVSWLPSYAGSGWTLDLMRRRNGAMPGLMEFLIASSALQFKAEGYSIVSLGASPLPQSGEKSGLFSTGWLLDRLKGYLQDYYNFDSLRAFKAKFQPDWSPLHVFYPGGLGTTRGGLAILSLSLAKA